LSQYALYQIALQEAAYPVTHDHETLSRHAMKPMDLRRLPEYNYLAIQKTEGDTGKIMIRISKLIVSNPRGCFGLNEPLLRKQSVIKNYPKPNEGKCYYDDI